MTDYTVSDWLAVATTDEGYNRNEEKIILDTAGTIDLGEYSLPQLMVDLQPYLAEETDLIDVAKALKLLAPVLNALVEKPPRYQVHALVEYLCSRLANMEKLRNYRAGIKELVSALEVLVSWGTFPPSDAAHVASAVFAASEQRTFRDQMPTTRLKLFKLVVSLLKSYKAAIKRDMGFAELVQGIVSMGAAEKNPSCLAVLFPLYTKLCRPSFQLKHSDLDIIWDSFMRYFPVTVGGAVNDPSIPGREILRELLLKCILAHNHFAPKAFERIIDLLDSSTELSANNKNDYLSTLVSCINSYSPQAVAEWSFKLWDALKFEIWNGENEDFIEGSLKVINALPAVFDPVKDWSNNENDQARFILNSMKECKSRMTEPGRLRPTAKILYSIGSSTPYGFYLVSSVIVPTLLALWQDVTLESEKKNLLGVFNTLLRARLRHSELALWDGIPSPLRPKPLAFSLMGSFPRAKLPIKNPNGQNSDSSDEAQYEDRGSLEFKKTPQELDEERRQSYLKMKAGFANLKNNFVEVLFGLLPAVGALTGAVNPDRDAPLGLSALQGISLLFEISDCLSETERHTVLLETLQIAMSEKTNEGVRDSILKILTEMSACRPDEFQKVTLEQYIGKLPVYLSADETQRAQEIHSVRSVLEDLMHIACSAPCGRENEKGQPLESQTSFWYRNLDVVVLRLLQFVDQVLQADNQLPYVNAIVASIYVGYVKFEEAYHRAILASPEPENLTEDHAYNWTVRHLFKLILEQKQTEHGYAYVGVKDWLNNTSNESESIVYSIGRLTMLAMRSSQEAARGYDLIRESHRYLPSKATQIRAEQHVLLKPSSIWTLLTTGNDQRTIAHFQWKLEHGPADKCLASVLSMYLLAGFPIDRKQKVPQQCRKELHFSPGEVAVAMIKNATSTTSKASYLSRSSMLFTLQLLVNKYEAESDIRQTSGQPLVEQMLSLVSDIAVRNDIEVRYIIQTLAYYASAALAAGHPSSKLLIMAMLRNITNPKVDRLSAVSFRILLAPSAIINEENFCILRTVRKAMFFNLAFRKLRDYWITGDRAGKDNSLIALAGVLGHMNPQVYAEPSTVALLLPLVLDGTNVTGDTWARSTFTQTLKELVNLCPEIIEEHRRSVISRMIDRTHNTPDSPSDSDVATRVLALDVLTTIIKTLPASSVLKERGVLNSELSFALNDPSREVREQAQRCRTALLCVAEPIDG